MAKIVAEKLPFEQLEMSREEAEKWLQEKDQTYKLERLAAIPEGEAITFYKCGDFMDLCRGPHVETTGDVRAFKLTSVAGSYFHGIETNPMLQRVYGIAAESPKAIRAIIKQIEEAAKRDHRKLGKDLDLFSSSEDVGPGLTHWHMKGARIRSAIEDFWRREHYRGGYELVYTPHIGRSILWERSGHLEFYGENMYAPMDIDGSDYYVKPMNCPFHIQIYKTQKRSYRELPMRMAELGTVYRYEKSGVLHGLLRVRGFTQDDAHIFCTHEQMMEEVAYTVRFALRLLGAFGFSDISAYLATRPAKAVGEEERWSAATESLEEALKAEGIAYETDEGGGAFYGPKIDLKIKDAIGREWQLSTIQFDFNLPERFDLTYVGDDGAEHRPYMVHRALLGSLERFFGILVEHYGGAFPLWLAPEQVRVIPLTEKELDYAQSVLDRLRAEDFRASLDEKSERMGAKIRRAQNEKIPYMVIVGPKEMEAGEVAIRHRKEGDQGAVSLDKLIEQLNEECRQQQ
jgi:threonyl-tRNA synthetase